MKRTISIMAFISILFSIFTFFVGQAVGLSYDPTSTYQSSAVVAEVDELSGWITFVDWNGEAWCIRDDSFAEGELVIVTFNNSNTTETIYDDVIIEVQRGRMANVE